MTSSISFEWKIINFLKKYDVLIEENNLKFVNEK